MDRPADERAIELIVQARPETHIPVATDGSLKPSVFSLSRRVSPARLVRQQRNQQLDIGKSAVVSDERGWSRPDPACTRDSHGDQITNKPPRRVRIDPSPARGSQRQGGGGAVDQGGTGRRRALPSFCAV
jgi:hypothetical protein